ncbi:MAG: addiction module protein [Verrucomicrobia bacterium]|nr:addiction module protein [Verrucomicrobiota bacterium]
MTADSIDISNLSSGGRVVLMKRLWRSLSGELETQGPPAWHDAELESRKGEWANRGSLSQEWPVVREELRREKIEQDRRASD